MDINFYNTSSDTRCVNKELTNSTLISFNIREDVNVHEFDVLTDNTIDFNYAYVENFNRYYYVEQTKINATLRRLHFKCDVLMSFADLIKNQTVTLKRSSNMYNGYLNDNEFQAYSYEEVVCKEFPNGMFEDSIILMTIG